MRYIKFLISTLFTVIFVAMFSLCGAGPAAAQTPIERPDFTISEIENSLESMVSNDNLTEDQKSQIQGFLDTAKTALANATKHKEAEAIFRTEFENAAQTFESLEQQIAEKQALAEPKSEGSDEEPMREEALVKLEQALLTQESRVSALRSELEGYETGLQNLAIRQVAAPDELTETREKLGELTAQITELGDAKLDSVGEARRTSLVAQRYSNATKLRALEREIAGLSERAEILTARRNLAELKLDGVDAEVKYLQDKTGQGRANEAAQVKSDALSTLTLYAESHPLVQDLARSNVALADSLVTLASDANLISKHGAAVRSRLDDVESDLRVARDFIALGDLDRQAGATLRRLSNQLQAPQAIKNNIDTTQKTLIALTQRRLIAQDTLRDLPIGRPDFDRVLERARLEDPSITTLTAGDETSYGTLYTQHRDMLLRVSSASTTRINEIVELQNQQKGLLTSTVELKDLLDEKLLWVPSSTPINFAWPRKVIKGAFLLFSPEHINLVVREAISQLILVLPFMLIFIIIFGGIIFMRPRLWADIYDRGKMVGDVSSDSFWHTPIVILTCILVALPIPLIFLLFAGLFEISNSPDPLIDNVQDTFLYLAVFSLFFLTWQAWDEDKSLFDTHFKLPEIVRTAFSKNFKWFIPFTGVNTALVGFSEGSPTNEISEGFSLFFYIISALALAILSYRIIYVRSRKRADITNKDIPFKKYKIILGAIFIAGPLLSIGMAASGYYDTSTKFLWRLFVSGWLVLLTYVVYGFIHRTVVVAHRRLALREAVAKRDAAVMARQQKAEAEERGDIAPSPPPIDTSQIDIKAISRQSSQLLNTLVVLGFAGLMWLTWSDLLPALSIFNDVVLGSYTGQVFDDAGAIIDTKIPITLWNLIQSVVILALTYISAKNLPGFLEVFVLSRSGLDAGTRYAVRTILGYIIIAVGIVIGFDRLGLQWSQLRWIVTGLSVGIGFGLQKIIANFISGLILLFERPIRIGDYVTIGEQSGTVSRIKIRATTLSDLDNREILIPNEALISERVTNWTLSNSVTRLIIPVGIAYGSDTDIARDIMLKVLKDNSKVLDKPAPNVLFTGFGDSSLDFQLRVFLNNFEDRWPVTHLIHTEVNKALEEAGISIPFPQTDLHIVSQNGPLEIGPKPTSKSKPKK